MPKLGEGLALFARGALKGKIAGDAAREKLAADKDLYREKSLMDGLRQRDQIEAQAEADIRVHKTKLDMESMTGSSGPAAGIDEEIYFTNYRMLVSNGWSEEGAQMKALSLASYTIDPKTGRPVHTALGDGGGGTSVNVSLPPSPSEVWGTTTAALDSEQQIMVFGASALTSGTDAIKAISSMEFDDLSKLTSGAVDYFDKTFGTEVGQKRRTNAAIARSNLIQYMADVAAFNGAYKGRSPTKFDKDLLMEATDATNDEAMNKVLQASFQRYGGAEETIKVLKGDMARISASMKTSYEYLTKAGEHAVRGTGQEPFYNPRTIEGNDVRVAFDLNFNTLGMVEKDNVDKETGVLWQNGFKNITRTLTDKGIDLSIRNVAEAIRAQGIPKTWIAMNRNAWNVNKSDEKAALEVIKSNYTNLLGMEHPEWHPDSVDALANSLAIATISQYRKK
jgi:hypothetical protein